MTAPVDIPELERLLGAVTDEPWAALPGSALMVQGDEYRGSPVAEFERPGDHSDPLEWPVVTREEWDTWKSRLRLVVALRNAAPALLAELKAAREEIDVKAERIAGLEKENWRVVAMLEGDFALTRMHYEEGKPLELQVRAAALGAFAANCRDFLADAENYVEMAFADDLGELSVTIQKREGATPHQKREKAEAELRLAADRIAALERCLRPFADINPYFFRGERAGDAINLESTCTPIVDWSGEAISVRDFCAARQALYPNPMPTDVAPTEETERWLRGDD